MRKLILQLLVLSGFFISFTSFENQNLFFKYTENYNTVNKIYPDFISTDTSWADSVLATLTLEEKIAQMIMVAAYSNKGEDHLKDLTHFVEKNHIGGIVFFQGGPVRQALMTNHLQSKSKVPLLIAMDAEWGLGMRLDSVISYPKQISLGAIRDNEILYQMGYHIGNQLKSLGVHVNFAPVADINNNPKNPVINFRSFGEERLNVALKAFSYASGLEDAGIIATLKHFPGHGDTDKDSHFTLPVISHSRERLDSVELFPFSYGISRGIPAIMTAHLHIPVLDSTPALAASLSPSVVTSLLKEEMGFKGLIFTDALSMKGVSNFFKPGELETKAFIAGNDILLMPSDVDKTINYIKKEVRKGNISVEDINMRCRKILLAKYWAGLNKEKTVQTDLLFEYLNSPYFKAFKNEIVRSSFTVVRNNDKIIPFENLTDYKIASLAIGNGETDAFSETLKLYTEVDNYFISKSADYASFDSLVKEIKGYNTLIISIHETTGRQDSNYGISDQTLELIKNIEFKGKIVLCIFGNPYSLELFEELENIQVVVVANENTGEYKQLAAQGIFGAFHLNGSLPVSAGSAFSSGTGIYIPFIQRLSYGIPEEVLINSVILDSIEILANEAISQKAAPGCQVLVARYGKVVYHKAFGFHSYNGKKKLSTNDLFDLASITKIAATLPVLMQLFENGIIEPDQAIGKYLPALDSTNKTGLTISDILLHQAGLQSWIPFYYSLLEPIDTSQKLFSTAFSEEHPLKLANSLYVNRNIRLKEDAYREKFFPPDFTICLAENIYLNRSYKDTVYQYIITSPVNNKRQYLYSDIGNYLFQLLMEELTGSFLYPYTYKTFYSKIGANTLGYLPLNRFPKERIVPTENDLIFRKQLLQGYVHDPGAAMLGGIAGHAGLFSNANDLAKMMQMYLNGGIYGGERFLSDSVIKKFTSSVPGTNGNRRGLGFDKPEPDMKKNGPSSKLASPLSYGHTGFTGTIVWVDPQYDLVYIFLSNRIHPDQANLKLIELNIRTKIHDVIYRSLLDLIRN